ncbi:unnamed protein product [Fraxinus pennsylvanica]|uniref:Uncharacterized protein n=1 Tax=Fraxinus pennsylvanica TaxID=56036 RepID=A0AAD2DVE0_9LAMI|nr:unnamed protein product [Fraxinus pennsylvanica]
MDKGKAKNPVGESSGSNLNPNAQPFKPPANAPERTLFMKFFPEFPPISRQAIHEYFTGRFGNCIECVYVLKLNSDLGFIIFSRSLFPYVIMGPLEEVVLFICSRPVLFKRSLGRGGAVYLRQVTFFG